MKTLMPIDLRLGDCLEKLKELPENSVDSIVTDPPYGIGFMGKKWDTFSENNLNSALYKRQGENNKRKPEDSAYANRAMASGCYDFSYNGMQLFQTWFYNVSKECLRVLKPGGHLLSFCGTRTYHRMAVAIEDAGFEVRDMIEWIYASGFPKSLNIGKGVDKLQGNEREVVGTQMLGGNAAQTCKEKGGTYASNTNSVGVKPIEVKLTKGSSIWEGFGTALKPAHEPIILARKPLSEKTIVENVLKHGTGGIDIDGCRIPTSEDMSARYKTSFQEGNSQFVSETATHSGKRMTIEPPDGTALGRFPANIICSDDALNDGEMTKSVKCNRKPTSGTQFWGNSKQGIAKTEPQDSGSKSRYFDIDVWAEKHGLLQFPKASKRERNEGCEGLEEKERESQNIYFKCKKCGLWIDKSISQNRKQQRPNSTCNCNEPIEESVVNKSSNHNNHPTVKPVHLMSWLIRLVTPPDGVCLDPFMGSGTTGVACRNLGRKFIGIEKEPEYMKIAEARINLFGGEK